MFAPVPERTLSTVTASHDIVELTREKYHSLLKTLEAMASNLNVPSLAVCAPHVRQPSEEYLSSIRSFLLSDNRLLPLTREIQKLQGIWDTIASHRVDIAALSEGPRYIKALSEWIEHGESSILREAKSGIVAIQTLVIIQVVQYFQYLELSGRSHAEFIDALRKGGGIQGNCAGLLPAIAIGCAKDEGEVVQNALAALCVGLAIGAYQQLGDDESIPGATTIVLRLSTPGEGDEIVGRFPGVSNLPQATFPICLYT